MPELWLAGERIRVSPADNRCYADIVRARGEVAAQAVLGRALQWMPVVRERHPVAVGLQRQQPLDLVVEALLYAAEVPSVEVPRVARRYLRSGGDHWPFAGFSNAEGINPTDADYLRAPKGPSATGRDGEAAAVRSVEVERQYAKWFNAHTREEKRHLTRREHTLMLQFKQHLESRGCRVESKVIDVHGGGMLRTDLFNADRDQLIEVKDEPSRERLRMALGQLADYRRFIRPEASAVCLIDRRLILSIF